MAAHTNITIKPLSGMVYDYITFFGVVVGYFWPADSAHPLLPQTQKYSLTAQKIRVILL